MTMLWTRFGGLLLLAGTILFLVAVPTQAQGGDVFKAKCAACHSADGSGSSAMGKQLQAPDLRSEDVQKKSDADLITATTNGVGKKMPAYKGKLTDDQIKQVVVYIRELAKK
jgi:mono/diheme cytochrome c family protein